MNRLGTPLFVLSVLVGCDSAEGPACEDLPTVPRQGVVGQGIGTSPSGIELNGIALNAVYNNGITLNGITLNGIDLNAMSSNGIALEGMRIDGIDLVGVALRRTELVGVGEDGRTVELGDVRGFVLPARTDRGETLELVIDAVASEGELTYYALSLGGENVCGPEGRGLFVEGTWDPTGARIDDPNDAFSTTFSCTTGVIAKCVAWGYTPWGVGVDAHQTCTRLARADYCGDGVSYTKDGTEIDVFDRLGVQRPTPDRDDLQFEAGWGPEGAVCVDAPRYEMVLPDGEELLPPCWEGLPRCASEAEAIAAGAMLANRSHGDLRSVCGP